jgi:hypothetical protein
MIPKEISSNSEKVDYLRNCIHEGYLLHGGKILVDALIPKQSTDDDSTRTTGQAFAVYAEASDIRVPILMALFAEKDPSKKSWRSSYSANGNGPMKVGGENYTFTPGYVYVLPNETFTTEGDEQDREFISRVSVVPKEVIPVDPSILSELEGIEFEGT